MTFISVSDQWGGYQQMKFTDAVDLWEPPESLSHTTFFWQVKISTISWVTVNQTPPKVQGAFCSQGTFKFITIMICNKRETTIKRKSSRYNHNQGKGVGPEYEQELTLC